MCLLNNIHIILFLVGIEIYANKMRFWYQMLCNYYVIMEAEKKSGEQRGSLKCFHLIF